jgi:hypothetical protein
MNASYKSLKTELNICKTGGVFLALYRDKNQIDSVISSLEKDLPDFFSFRLVMTPEKIGFPGFFEGSFNHTGKQSNIFHVIRTEEMPDRLQTDFIAYLQFTRERFKSEKYSIIFWVTPDFEKRMANSSIDFYDWITGVYDFSHPEPETDQIENIKTEDFGSLFHVKINEYLKKVIWQYEHWREVNDKNQDFLIEIIGRADLNEYYVESYCIDQHEEELKLDHLLAEFIEDNHKNFLTLLGDFGTGKSSFSLHYFIKLAKKYLHDNSGRIPIFISLKDYRGRLNIQDFMEKEFYEKFNINISFKIFTGLALQGKFIFFVDGFDEMACLADEKLTGENLKEITKLTFEHILFMTQSAAEKQKADKVFLTCRSHYFLTRAQEKQLLKADKTIIYRDYAQKTNYQLARIRLKEFDDKQIIEYVYKNAKNKKQTENILKIIKNTYNLKELSTRPLLLEMIVKTLPDMESKKKINAADLYKAYTDLWIERDDWRSCMTPRGKRAFMWELAFKMFRQGGDFSIHYSKLDKPDKNNIKKESEHKEDAYYIYDTTTCSFLNRDSKGNYRFIHKSFMEFFLAEYYFEKRKTWKESPGQVFNKETQFFLKFIVSSLKGPDLSDIVLNRVNFSGADLRRADLRRADLRGADLRGADLTGADFYGANLVKANLSGANLSEADLSNADLREANLYKADLSGANLYKADLSGSYSYRADFSGAHGVNGN